MNNIIPIYQKSNYVQKRKIHSILILNIIINKKKASNNQG